MTPRERAVAACDPFLMPSILLPYFPSLVGRRAPGNDSNETHFTDEYLRQAIAMPASEAQLLYDLTARIVFERGIEIGAYVGWSTAHVVAACHSGRNSVQFTVIDPFSESTRGPGETEERFWANLERVGHANSIGLVRAKSPDILPIVKPRHGWDFAFIDGEHTGGQPLKDIQGLLPCLTDDAIVVWHDGWLSGVQEAIAYQAAQGWTTHELPTANKMTICYRGDRPYWLDEIEAKAREYVAVANG